MRVRTSVPIRRNQSMFSPEGRVSIGKRPCGQNGFWIYAKSPCIESTECPALKRVFCSIALRMPRRVYVPAQRGEREDSYARPDRFSAGEVGRNPDHVQTVGKFQKGVKYIVPFFMRMTACPRTPSFPDFHQEFFFARLRPNSAPARMTGLNLLCAVALPGMIYPEDTAFKSTRPPEPGWSERRPCTRLNSIQYPWECRRE